MNLVLILISILIFIFLYDNQKIDIGNALCQYFYYLGLAILQKQDFNNPFKYDFKNNFFFESLPNYIKYEFDDIYNCLTSKGIKYENFSKKWDVSTWGLANIEELNFWKCMKPLVNKILDETFKKCGLEKKIDYPVIHYRCADTPFLKYMHYHFQYYSFFIDALEKIFNKLNKRYDKLYLMSCTSHKSNNNNKKSCNIYANSLQDFLKENKFNTEIICNSPLDDFATLFYAPIVISTGSSFSFMGGFFGNGEFITTSIENYSIDNSINNFVNNIVNFNKFENDTILYNYNLTHDKVNDYHDTNSVINLLKNKNN
jgi:hypothetical protein